MKLLRCKKSGFLANSLSKAVASPNFQLPTVTNNQQPVSYCRDVVLSQIEGI